MTWCGTTAAGPMCVQLYGGTSLERRGHPAAVFSPGALYTLLDCGGQSPWGSVVQLVGTALCTMPVLLWRAWAVWNLNQHCGILEVINGLFQFNASYSQRIDTASSYNSKECKPVDNLIFKCTLVPGGNMVVLSSSISAKVSKMSCHECKGFKWQCPTT